MQAVSFSFCFGSSESDVFYKLMIFQKLQKSTRISFDISVCNSPIDTDRFHAMVCDISRLSLSRAELTLFIVS